LIYLVPVEVRMWLAEHTIFRAKPTNPLEFQPGGQSGGKKKQAGTERHPV